MTDIILTGAKYLIIILFAYFTYISFRAQRDVPDERKKLAFNLQRITMLLIHALAFLSICINITLYDTIDLEMGKVIGLYAGQLVYLVVMSWVIPAFVSLSQGLNNVMCMFLSIGFIIQTRLDFDSSLRQFIIVLVSSVVFLVFVFLCKRAKFLRNLTYIYAVIGMALLALVLILSRVVHGAKLAIDLGFFSFQPAEFVKIIFVLFVASAFYHSNDMKTVFKTAVVAAVHVLILVFCHDLGSALILFMIYLLMLYAATKKLLYVGIGLGALVVGGVASYFLFDHVKNRVTAWLDPWSTIDSNGYQIAQALFAIGTGGWFGSGLFGGAPRTVPMVTNDMIFSAISEELGGIFAILLILLCLCYVLMIFRVSIRVNNTFYKLLAFGLGAAYGFQVFLTIGGTIKFIPLTGVNLPFISSGGSSILASMMMIGMVQALYVISEADVEHERELVAAGVPLKTHPEVKGDSVSKHHPEPEPRIMEYQEEDLYSEYYEPHPVPNERIRQVKPDHPEPMPGNVKGKVRKKPSPQPPEKRRVHHMVPQEESHHSQEARIEQMIPMDEADELRNGEYYEEERRPHPKKQRKRIRQIDDDDF